MADPLRIFPDEFVPNEQSSTNHKKWVQANPNEAAKWAAYRDKVLAYEAGGAAIPVPSMATPHGKALVAAGELHMSVTDIGADWNPPPAPPPPDPIPTGTLIWNGDLDTGNESQWTNIIRNATDRFRVTTSDTGVAPRQGTHMARVEVRQGEAASWASTLSATLAVRQFPTVGYNQTYNDIYFAWSAWVPSNWPYADPDMHSIFMEWHGNGAMIQAPFHWGILAAGANVGKFFVDLHRDPTAYSPVSVGWFDHITSAGMGNAWHNYTCRIKWSMASDGVFQFWQDGVLRHNYFGPTAPITGESLKLQAGCYMKNGPPASKVLYLDEMKVGTTYDIVQPG
jgi:polysaccharide lyase-like protein